MAALEYRLRVGPGLRDGTTPTRTRAAAASVRLRVWASILWSTEFQWSQGRRVKSPREGRGALTLRLEHDWLLMVEMAVVPAAGHSLQPHAAAL